MKTTRSPSVAGARQITNMPLTQNVEMLDTVNKNKSSQLWLQIG